MLCSYQSALNILPSICYVSFFYPSVLTYVYSWLEWSTMTCRLDTVWRTSFARWLFGNLNSTWRWRSSRMTLHSYSDWHLQQLMPCSWHLLEQIQYLSKLPLCQNELFCYCFANKSKLKQNNKILIIILIQWLVKKSYDQSSWINFRHYRKIDV